MTEWRIPEYSGDLSEFDKAVFWQELREADYRNKLFYGKQLVKHQLHRNILVENYGEGSEEVVLHDQHPPYAAPDLVELSWKPALKRYYRWLNNRRTVRVRNEREQRREIVHQVLQDMGFVPGQDYELRTALRFARKVLQYDDQGRPSRRPDVNRK